MDPRPFPAPRGIGRPDHFEELKKLIVDREPGSIKKYLKDLHEETPVFDALPVCLYCEEQPDSYWVEIARYLVGSSEAKTKKLLHIINSGLDYKERIESPDKLQALTSTRRQKDLHVERVPRFPFQV